MPEFTYQESDNYMAAQETEGMTDKKLISEWKSLQRDIKSGVAFQYNFKLQQNTLRAELEKRGLMEGGEFTKKKKERKSLTDEEKKERKKLRREEKRVKDLFAPPKIKPSPAQAEVQATWAEKQARKLERARNIIAGVDGGSVIKLTRWSWFVKSGATRTPHMVKEPDKGTLVCDCHDYLKGQGKIKCKHVLAVELFKGG